MRIAHRQGQPRVHRLQPDTPGLTRFEQTLGQRLPELQVLESILHLRPVKRMGWLLTDDGRCTGEVVVPSVFMPQSQQPTDE